MAGTAYRLAASSDASGDPAALLLTAYVPNARANRSHAGVQQVVRWRIGGQRAPALVLSFRSKQHLLLFPENAILQEPGTTHLRLPCNRAALLAALEATRPLTPQELESVVHYACTSWGQLGTYADRLIASVGERSESDEDAPRLSMLQDFARRHFGDWLDEALLQAEDCQKRGDTDEMARLLRAVQQRAPEAAVYRTFGALAHGREADLSNKGLGPLRATLLLMQQGIAGKEHLQQLLASDSWSRFTSALQSTARTLTLEQSGPTTLPDALRAEVDVFLSQLGALLRVTETGAAVKHSTAAEQPAATIETIDRLQEASRSALRQRAGARRRAGLAPP